MRIGFVITRGASLDVTWTTPALIMAALARGHQVRLLERTDFEIDGSGQLVARVWCLDPPGPSLEALIRGLSRRTIRRSYVAVSKLDLLFMRSTPLNMDLLSFALMAQEQGVRVVNDPAGMLRVSSKAWLAGVPDVPTPATLVTRSAGAAAVFFRAHGRVVVKPARGSGGRSVSRVDAGRTRQFDQAFATARRRGGFVVVQAYLPDAGEGEKRLLWLDGHILGGYLRRRAPGEFRHNLKRGAQAVPATVTDDERALLAPLAPHLLRAGIRFAGLDLIGSHLVEVNAVNPGGTFHTDRLTGSRHAHTVIEHLERDLPNAPIPKDSSWALPDP